MTLQKHTHTNTHNAQTQKDTERHRNTQIHTNAQTHTMHKHTNTHKYSNIQPVRDHGMQSGGISETQICMTASSVTVKND